MGKQVTSSVEERLWINWKPHRLRFGFQGLPSPRLYLYYAFFHSGCLSLLPPAWRLCKTQEWVASAFQEFHYHIAFPKPGLERWLQPNRSDTSLASSGQSNYSVITSRPIYRGSQTKAFHCSPIFLVPRPGFFIPCSAGCILCLPKTHLYNSSLHTLQEGKIPHCWFSISSFSDRDRLIPHYCCQRASYPTERRKRGSCSAPPTALPGSSPHTWESSSSPDLSAIGSPGHAAGLATRHEPACRPFQAQGALSTRSQEVNTSLATAPQPFPCWLDLAG